MFNRDKRFTTILFSILFALPFFHSLDAMDLKVDQKRENGKVQLLTSENYRFKSIQWSPVATLLAISAYNYCYPKAKRALFFSDTKTVYSQMHEPDDAYLTKIDWSIDGSHLYGLLQVINRYERCTIYDIEKNIYTHLEDKMHESYSSSCLATDPSGNGFATGHIYGDIFFWDVRQKKRIAIGSHQPPKKNVPFYHRYETTAYATTGLAWHKPGVQLASASYDGTVRLWDLRNKQSTIELQAKYGFNDVTINPTNKVITACCHRHGCLHKTDSSQTIAVGKSKLLKCQWSHDGQKIALQADDYIRILDNQSQTMCGLKDKRSFINMTHWSHTDTFVASESNKKIIIWDVTQAKKYPIQEDRFSFIDDESC